MTTKIFEQFDVLEVETLPTIQGGDIDWKRVAMCAGSFVVGTSQGYMATTEGTAVLGPSAVRTGAIGSIIGSSWDPT